MKDTGKILLILFCCAALMLSACGKNPTEEKPGEDLEPVPEENTVHAEKAEEVPEEPELIICTGPAVPSAQELADQYFREVASYQPGTAGSSLKKAMRASHVLSFAVEKELRNTDIPAFRENLLSGWMLLSDEERAYFDENFLAICEQIDACFVDWESNRGVFEDAGAVDTMEVLLTTPNAKEDWDTLKAHTLTMGNSDGD